MATARSEWETVPSLPDRTTHTSEGTFWQKPSTLRSTPKRTWKVRSSKCGFLLRGRKMGRRNIMENGLHLLCPSSFGRVRWEPGFPNNSQPEPLSDFTLLIDGGRDSPCSGFSCLHAKPGGSHPTPCTMHLACILFGTLTLLPRSQMEHKETHKKWFSSPSKAKTCV